MTETEDVVGRRRLLGYSGRSAVGWALLYLLVWMTPAAIVWVITNG